MSKAVAQLKRLVENRKARIEEVDDDIKNYLDAVDKLRTRRAEYVHEVAEYEVAISTLEESMLE